MKGERERRKERKREWKRVRRKEEERGRRRKRRGEREERGVGRPVAGSLSRGPGAIGASRGGLARQGPVAGDTGARWSADGAIVLGQRDRP